MKKLKEALDRVKLYEAYGDEPIEAYGVKGSNSTKWRKTFKNLQDMEKWVDQNNAEVQGTRKAEGKDNKWIQKAIKHPGALTKAFPKLAKKGFTNKELKGIIKTGSGKEKKMARLALTLKKLGKHKKK